MMLRSAVIKISLMSEKDRDWILKSLNVNERTRVQVLLDEINELGLNKHLKYGDFDELVPPQASSTSSDKYLLPDSINSFWRDLYSRNCDLKTNEALLLEEVPVGVISVLSEFARK